jgi:hypothetical protein
MQKKNDKMEIAEELLQYAAEAEKNNYTCRNIRIWLQNNHHDIQSFFAALIQIKRNNQENVSYEEVSQGFLAKFRTEISTWSPRFQSLPQPTRTVLETDNTKKEAETLSYT